MRLRRNHLPIVLQGLGAVVAIVGMTLWPPVSGRMLLVPLVGADTNRAARTALAGGAMLLGPGPFRGSMVVVGDRAHILHAVAAWDFVVTAAPPAGCGAVDPAGGVA